MPSEEITPNHLAISSKDEDMYSKKQVVKLFNDLYSDFNSCCLVSGYTAQQFLKEKGLLKQESDGCPHCERLKTGYGRNYAPVKCEDCRIEDILRKHNLIK